MARVLLLTLVAFVLIACGSEWHMPGENITMPSSVSVGPSSSIRQGRDTRPPDSPPGIRQALTTIPVFAHYMNWATVPGSWPTASVMPLRRDNPGGGYWSTNPDIIRQHNAEMQSSGILPMVSWWDKDTYAGDQFLDLYLTIPGPKVGILYEAVGPGRMQIAASSDLTYLARQFVLPAKPGEGLPVSRRTLMAVARSSGIDMGNPVNQNIFIEDMAHLQAKYFSGPYADRFFRIDGRPVVFIWISRAFYGPFEQVVQRARQRAAFYLVGSDFITPWSARPGDETVIRGMDAISSYGFYDPAHYGLEMPRDFVRDYDIAADAAAAWLARHSAHTKIMLPLGFAYDETRIPGRRGIVFRSSYEMARLYAEQARSKITDPCGSGRFLPFIYVTSYNEHYEGTAIEPTHEHQDRYLRIIRETFLSVAPTASPHAECGDDAERPEMPRRPH